MPVLLLLFEITRIHSNSLKLTQTHSLTHSLTHTHTHTHTQTHRTYAGTNRLTHTFRNIYFNRKLSRENVYLAVILKTRFHESLSRETFPILLFTTVYPVIFFYSQPLIFQISEVFAEM